MINKTFLTTADMIAFQLRNNKQKSTKERQKISISIKYQRYQGYNLKLQTRVCGMLSGIPIQNSFQVKSNTM